MALKWSAATRTKFGDDDRHNIYIHKGANQNDAITTTTTTTATAAAAATKSTTPEEHQQCHHHLGPWYRLFVIAVVFVSAFFVLPTCICTHSSPLLTLFYCRSLVLNFTRCYAPWLLEYGRTHEKPIVEAVPYAGCLCGVDPLCNALCGMIANLVCFL